MLTIAKETIYTPWSSRSCQHGKITPSGGARILEQVGPAAGPRIVCYGLKLVGLTIIIQHYIMD